MTARGRLLALVLAASVLAGCRFGAGDVLVAERETLPTARARRGAFEVRVEEVGVVVAASSVELSAPFWGQLSWVADEGDVVEAGAPCLVMDTSRLERRLERREAEIEEARSQLEKQLERIALQEKSTSLERRRLEAQQSFEEARFAAVEREAEDALRRAELGLIRQSEAERQERRLEQALIERDRARFVNERQVEELRSKDRQLAVERREAERRLARAERRVAEVRRRIEQSTVRAPAAGRVFLPKRSFMGGQGERKVRPGDRVGPWLGTLVELPDPTSLEVVSQIDEALVGRLAPGLRAAVRLAARSDVVVPARLAAVEHLAVLRSESDGAGFLERDSGREQQVVFPVRLALDEVLGGLQPGMGVEVSYVLDVVDDAVSVPEEAVLGDPGRRVVHVASPRPREQPVELGPSSGGWVVVTDGLDGSETVYLGDPRAAQGEA